MDDIEEDYEEPLASMLDMNTNAHARTVQMIHQLLTAPETIGTAASEAHRASVLGMVDKICVSFLCSCKIWLGGQGTLCRWSRIECGPPTSHLLSMCSILTPGLCSLHVHCAGPDE